MIPYELLKEMQSYEGYVYWCPECGFRTMLDRGKHFQCQNTTGENGTEECGVDYEYPGTHFLEPEKFEKWRQKIISSFSKIS